MADSFSCRQALRVDGDSYEICSLDAFAKKSGADLSRLPFSLKVLLENLLRCEDGRAVKPEDIEALAAPRSRRPAEKEIAFTPARVLMQDFTGVPAIVDLAAMRDAMASLGGDPQRINPLVPVDLVIDHSVMVDAFGTADSLRQNTGLEYERNRERYMFLRWGQKAFRNFRVVPPGTGICHQVNLEYLAEVVMARGGSAYFDTLVGTDSHTVMINGLGVLGWGVGGIEAEAAMLGQPVSMLIPDVVGFRLKGKLAAGATATDAVLTVTEMLRKKGVVGKFVEFFGPGLSALPLADRATIANMAPEYGATMGFFPIDVQTLRYLELTNRSDRLIRLVEAYAKTQGVYRTDATPDPDFHETLELDLGQVEPSLAGPKRPQDRVALAKASTGWTAAADRNGHVSNGSVVIAAITSCTNTSNPSVLIGAGLLAKKAVEAGLKTAATVKTSLAPGSKVVTEYLRATGLMPYLEQLGFHVVGYGCTTCIGNSGPLMESVTAQLKGSDVAVAAVLSGNRNFEGRVNPLVKANYLASPPLVVAYALAGHMGVNLATDPIGEAQGGKKVYLRDIWPTPDEISEAMNQVTRSLFAKEYAGVFDGDEAWRSLPAPTGERYSWDPASTYVKNPPYFAGMSRQAPGVPAIGPARVLAVLGDSVTTDHISPAGSIPKDSPAGAFLISRGVAPKDFNSYGARRGNDDVMVRGTFANIRLRNQLAPGTEGGWTTHIPSGKVMTIFDASERYRAEGVPLIVLAGKEYGSGSSRDWAAKGPALLGVRAVIAESYERIHRSNLVGMGVLPLQYKAGETRESLGLTGRELFTLEGLSETIAPKQTLRVVAEDDAGHRRSFEVVLRIDTPEEIAYTRHGGILPYVLRQLNGNVR